MKSLGVEIVPERSKIICRETDETTTVDIQVEDPSFATALLDKAKKPRQVQPDMEVVITNAKLPQLGSCARRVDARKVHVSWQKQTRTAWMNFGAEYYAKRVYDGFNSGRYNILGERVTATPPTCSNPSPSNPRAWTVVLTGLRQTTT